MAGAGYLYGRGPVKPGASVTALCGTGSVRRCAHFCHGSFYASSFVLVLEAVNVLVGRSKFGVFLFSAIIQAVLNDNVICVSGEGNAS